MLQVRGRTVPDVLQVRGRTEITPAGSFEPLQAGPEDASKAGKGRRDEGDSPVGPTRGGRDEGEEQELGVEGTTSSGLLQREDERSSSVPFF